MDCTTGRAVTRPLDDAELAEAQAGWGREAATRRAQEQQVAADEATVAGRAAHDPAFAALARLLRLPGGE